MMNDFSIRIEGNEGRTHCPFCTVIPDTENRITGNGEKWLQPLNLAGVVAIFLFTIRREGRRGWGRR